MPKKTAPKKIDLNKSYLRDFYKKAFKERIILSPDEALKKLEEVSMTIAKHNGITISSFKVEHPRIDLVAEARKLHHYAVDLYYDTYYGKKVGATPLDDKYLEYILQLSEKGLSYGQIAKDVGLPTSPPSELAKSSDKIRHQLKIAKKKLKN
ncbi:MAG TPA: hypothetical protein VNI02_18075 [Blastocatellia bacterium]|nr:hypothetical protein [Blastocatellia bacterium]